MMCYLDQYTGEVLRLDNDLKAPLAARIMNYLPLHIGSYGGDTDSLCIRWYCPNCTIYHGLHHLVEQNLWR